MWRIFKTFPLKNALLFCDLSEGLKTCHGKPYHKIPHSVNCWTMWFPHIAVITFTWSSCTRFMVTLMVHLDYEYFWNHVTRYYSLLITHLFLFLTLLTFSLLSLPLSCLSPAVSLSIEEPHYGSWQDLLCEAEWGESNCKVRFTLLIHTEH